MCGHVGLRPPVYSPELWDSSKRLQAKAILRHQSVPHRFRGQQHLFDICRPGLCQDNYVYLVQRLEAGTNPSGLLTFFPTRLQCQVILNLVSEL